MGTLLLALLPALLQEAPLEKGPAVHGLLLPYPSTWTRKEDPSGAVHLVPPQIEGTRIWHLSVLPPMRLEGTRWEFHKAIVKALLEQVKWAEEPVTVHTADAPGPFIRTSIAGKIPEGGLQQIELYTALHDDTMEAIVGVNGIDRNVVDPVLKAATFKVSPKAATRPRIVEAFRRLDQKLYGNREGGALTAGSLMYERIWLRSDGVADFSTTYPEGYAASPLVFKQDPGLADGNCGSWKAVGDRIHIVRRAGSPAEIYDRVNGSLRGGGKTWEPMPRVDGLKLSGRWRTPPSCIEFSDGKFSSEGALTQVAFGDVERPKPPEKATGTYEIRDWTIFFRFADGRTWSTDFSTLGPEPKSFTAILLRTTVFPREK